jgi:hypothetical protein
MIRSADQKEPKPDRNDPTKEKFPYIEVVFEVIEGEYKGETFTDRLSLSPKAAPRLAGFVLACGLVDPSAKGPQELNTEDLIHKVLVVKGDIETFQGFERFRPTSFKMHPDIAKTAEAKMNQEAKEAREQATANQAKPAARPASTPARRPI